jgi:tRNA 2-thiouridine synthesizing protein C
LSTESFLFVLSAAPYQGTLARASVDAALAFAAFDQPVRLLFRGPGVAQWLPEQDPSALGRRSHRRLLDSLPLYDVEDIFIDREAAQRYGLDSRGLPEGAVMLDAPGMRSLMQSAGKILSF